MAFTLPTTYLTSLHTHYQLLVLLNTAADSRIKHESAGARRITLSVWVATCGDPFCERFEVYSVHLKCRNHESLLHQEETQHPRNITQVSSSRSVLTVLSSFFLRERELTTLKRKKYSFVGNRIYTKTPSLQYNTRIYPAFNPKHPLPHPPSQ